MQSRQCFHQILLSILKQRKLKSKWFFTCDMIIHNVFRYFARTGDVDGTIHRMPEVPRELMVLRNLSKYGTSEVCPTKYQYFISFLHLYSLVVRSHSSACLISPDVCILVHSLHCSGTKWPRTGYGSMGLSL